MNPLSLDDLSDVIMDLSPNLVWDKVNCQYITEEEANAVYWERKREIERYLDGE